MDSWGERYRANPADPDAAVRYAQALRAVGQRAQAAAVLEQAAIHNPETIASCSAPMAGRSPTTAATSRRSRCSTARTRQDQPDWRILSVQGAVLDQMGRHADAQRLLRQRAAADAGRAVGAVQSRTVLRAVEEPAAGRGDACGAPRRSAGAEPKVRQNLALVVGLQGRFQEAETIAKGDLSPDEAAANVAYLRQMLAQQSDWKKGKRGSPLTPTTGS